jgi:hypothetical protein
VAIDDHDVYLTNSWTTKLATARIRSAVSAVPEGGIAFFPAVTVATTAATSA